MFYFTINLQLPHFIFYYKRNYRPDFRTISFGLFFILIAKSTKLPYAPEEFADRATLWNSVEQAEKGQKAQLARMLKASLPNEWSYELAEEMYALYETYRTARQYLTGNLIIKYNSY